MKKVGVTCSQEKYTTAYVDALRSVGLEPIILAPGHEPGILGTVSGLVLTGGPDLNPALYHEEPHPETQKPNDGRDTMELALLQEAFKRNMPVLAICRGIQMLNVLKGGTLVQHLDTVDRHRVSTKPEDDKSQPAHAVHVKARTKLAKIIGEKTIQVNSRHHQAVGELGKGLRVSAIAEDGTVEGLELPRKKFVVAVQWHPENELQRSESSRRLFHAFAEAL